MVLQQARHMLSGFSPVPLGYIWNTTLLIWSIFLGSSCVFPRTPLTLEIFISSAEKTFQTKLAAKLFQEQLCLWASINTEAVKRGSVKFSCRVSCRFGCGRGVLSLGEWSVCRLVSVSGHGLKLLHRCQKGVPLAASEWTLPSSYNVFFMSLTSAAISDNCTWQLSEIADLAPLE